MQKHCANFITPELTVRQFLLLCFTQLNGHCGAKTMNDFKSVKFDPPLITTTFVFSSISYIGIHKERVKVLYALVYM